MELKAKSLRINENQGIVCNSCKEFRDMIKILKQKGYTARQSLYLQIHRLGYSNLKNAIPVSVYIVCKNIKISRRILINDIPYKIFITSYKYVY